MYRNDFDCCLFSLHFKISILSNQPFSGTDFALGKIFILTFILMSNKLVLIRVKLQSGIITLPKIISKQTNF